jgi:tetratricopeptide (TPR) repeat protein
MALRFLDIVCFSLLAVLPLCAAANQSEANTAARADTSQANQAQSSKASSAIPSRPAPLAPDLSERRAMSPEGLDELGDRLRQAKDYSSALDCYREAIRKHATAEYYNKVAISELLLMHPEKAEKAAKKAVRKDRYLAEAWNNLGVTYYMQHKLAYATRCYREAISLKPNFASFHNNLAAALLDSKLFDRGLAEYRVAFELDPSFFEHSSQNGISAHMGSPRDRAQFSFAMARLFAGTGDFDRALHYLRSAIEDGYPEIEEVYRDREFVKVRNDERFLALMKERPVAVR